MFRWLLGSRHPASVPSVPASTGTRDPEPVEVGHVFNAGGRPTVTLIDRSHTPAYRTIEAALRRPGKIVSLHGESKSGKTTLCLQALQGKYPLQIHATDAKTLDDFWTAVRNQLGAPAAVDKEIMGTATDRDSETVGVDLKIGPVRAGLGGEKSTEDSTSISVRQQYSGPGKSSLIDRILKSGGVIVLDDFHWIPSEVQKAILRDLRPLLNNNGTVVVISVPERAELLLSQDHEMSTLVTLIEAPRWEVDEIASIGKKGFAALNIIVDERILRRLAIFSHKNPLLMQEHCHQLSVKRGISKRSEEQLQLNVSREDIRDVCKDVASTQAPRYRRYVNSKGVSWRTSRGANIDIYTLILLGMRHIAFQQEIGRERLSEKISEIIGAGGRKPDRGTITRALVQMTKDMRKDLGDNTPIEYDERTGRVYFLDPFFMAYMQWEVAPSVGEDFPE